LIEDLDLDFIERGEVAIEYDALAADGVDGQKPGIRHGDSRA
jgi:hypothetical protein